MQKATKTIKMQLPNYLLDIAEKVTQKGFQIFLVGGALRDTLINKPTSDYDLTTDALPEQIQKIFPESVDVGIEFGTVVIPVYNPKTKKYSNVEITTMRNEASYKDFRHPEKINFIKSIEQDLERRDFTINALAGNLANITPDKTKNKFEYITVTLPIIDLFDGLNDLKNKIIKAVNDPYQRLLEDPVRAIRACRFSAQLEYTIEENTFKAIQKIAPYISKISNERIHDEFLKLFKQADKPSIALRCLHKTKILDLILPELTNTINVKQPIGHIHDVFEHSLHALDLAPKDPIIRLAVLFHDIGKPYTQMPDGHFYGHDLKGAEITRKILKRLKFSNQIIDQVTTLVRWHMFHYIPGVWTDSAVRRFIKKVGINNLPALFELRKADALSNPRQIDPTANLNAFKKHIKRIMSQDLALTTKDLNISGSDLITQLNIKPGPFVGEILNYLLDQVIEDPKLNKKELLLDLAKKYKQQREKQRTKHNMI